MELDTAYSAAAPRMLGGFSHVGCRIAGPEGWHADRPFPEYVSNVVDSSTALRDLLLYATTTSLAVSRSSSTAFRLHSFW